MKTNEGQTLEKKEEKAAKVSTLDGLVFTNPGSHKSPVYKRIFVKESNANLVQKVDETDLFEFIQASKSQTDIALLEKRYLELGEIPSVDPNYGAHDLSQFPDDIHGVYDLVNNVDANYNKLPQSVKDVFGSRDAYLKALMDGTYQATLVNAFTKAAQKQETANEEQKGE